MTDHTRQHRFEQLLAEHGRIVFKIAGIYARAEDRRDLAQEIIIQLWRSFDRYDERQAKFSTWIYRIALNVAISASRRRHGSLASRLEPLEQHHLETIAGTPPPVEKDERIGVLYAFIGELDPLNRALILLYLDERPYAEIADILGISETNVATKIGRIKQTLRDRMTGSPSQRT